MEITAVKRIVKTHVQGSGRGTVKELVSESDYMLSIRGVLVGEEAHTFPEKEIKVLQDLYSKEGTVKIESELTRLLSINEICIEELKWIDMEGEPFAQGYQIKAYSDEPFELELKNKGQVF